MDRKKKIKWVAGFGLLVATVALAVPPRVIINPSGGDVEFRRPTSGGNSELVGKIGTTAGEPIEFAQGVEIPTGKKLVVDKIEGNAGGTPPGMIPVGGMVSVMPHLHANAWQPPASGAVKDGFMRADGAAVPAGCTDCVIPAGTTMPNMTNRYLRGNTNSGAIAGSNTHTPTGTVSQPTFTGTSGTYTVSVPAHYHDFTGTSNTAALSTDISHSHGTVSVTGTVDIDHDHGSTAVTGGTTNIGHTHEASTVSGTVGGSDGTHTHTLNNAAVANSSHTHTEGTLATNLDSSGTYLFGRFKISGVGPWTSSHGVNLGTAFITNNSPFSSGIYVTGTTAGPSGTATVSVNTTSSGHGHGFSLSAAGQTYGTSNVTLVGATVDLPNYDVAARALASGTTATISLGSTPTTTTGSIGYKPGSGAQSGNIAFNASGSNTPAGTVSQPSFTGNSQNTEPAYMEVVWVVRVK